MSMIDIHCHILPGLDDGAQFLDESVRMAKLAWDDGIEKIVAAPHIYRGGSDLKNPQEIKEKCTELNITLKQHGIETAIYSGAEIHVSHNFLDNVKMFREYFTINRSSYLLVEFPSSHIYSNVKDLFFKLMEQEIIPIIAHPERNGVFMEHPGLLYDLILSGAFTQANSRSFSGLYGRKVQEAVIKFLRLNLIHFIGSDGHNTMSHSPKLSEAFEQVKLILGEAAVKALFNDNALAVLEDRELAYVPEPTDPKTLKKSLKIKLPRIFQKKYT